MSIANGQMYQEESNGLNAFRLESGYYTAAGVYSSLRGGSGFVLTPSQDKQNPLKQKQTQIGNFHFLFSFGI